jgi:ABC-2 type transport system permease protein
MEHVLTIDTPRLATFLVACAPFRESVATSASGVRVRVLRSAMAAADGDVEAPLGGKIVSFYETLWPAYPRRDLKIVETPTPLGEALAFDGEVAISDKIIASRNPLAGSASNLLEFVMAHEIAHQWWGFNVVPSNAPGRLFVLESIAQFAAYKFLAGQGILSEQRARQNEERRYRAAHARLGNHEAPLIRSEVADEVAYNKGPFALLSIDQMGGGSIMNRLGELIADNSYESHGAAGAEQLAAALIGNLPQQSREAARSLLYDAGETAHP